MNLVLGFLGTITGIGSRIVLYRVMNSIYEGISKYISKYIWFSLGYMGSFSLKVSVLIYGWNQASECERIAWYRKTVKITDFARINPVFTAPMPGRVMSTEGRWVTEVSI